MILSDQKNVVLSKLMSMSLPEIIISKILLITFVASFIIFISKIILLFLFLFYYFSCLFRVFQGTKEKPHVGKRSCLKMVSLFKNYYSKKQNILWVVGLYCGKRDRFFTLTETNQDLSLGISLYQLHGHYTKQEEENDYQ